MVQKGPRTFPMKKIILNDSKLSILWAKNEVILNFITPNGLLGPIFDPQMVMCHGTLLFH